MLSKPRLRDDGKTSNTAKDIQRLGFELTLDIHNIRLIHSDCEYSINRERRATGASSLADLDPLLANVPPEEMPGYRALVVSMPVCGFHVLAAAGLGDDERLIRSLTAVESAVDDATQETAKSRLGNVIEEMLEGYRLTRFADAVYLAIATETTETFQHRPG